MTNFVINIADGAYNDVKAAVEALGSSIEPLASGISSDFTTALVTAIKQLPQLFLDVVVNAVPVVVAAAPTLSAAAIASAVEASAIQTLSTQGKAIADADLVAFKGAVLATVASTQAQATAP